MNRIIAALVALPLLAAAPTTPTRVMMDDAIARARTLMMTDPAAARKVGEDLEARLATAPKGRDRVVALSRARWIEGEATMREGDVEHAQRLIQSALALATTARDTQARADAVLSRGSLLQDTGHPALALSDFVAAAELFRATGNARSQSITLHYMAALYDDAGDYERAARYLDDAAGIYSQDPRINISRETMQGGVYMSLSMPEKAARHYRSAAAIARTTGNTQLEAKVLASQAEAFLSMGRTEDAGRALDQSERIMRKDGVAPTDEQRALRALWHARTNDVAKAVDLTALLATSVDDRTGRSSLLVHQAAYEVYKQAGRTEDALRQLEIISAYKARSTKAALSARSALLAARFDYEGQRLRIAQLREKEMRQRYDDERQSSERRWTGTVTAAVGAYVLVTLLTFGVITLRRSRDKVRATKDDLQTANDALAIALEEVRERAAAERRAMILADHDTLTGLPNRRHMHERLGQRIGDPATMHEPCTVMLLDLDRFKAVNDVHGHQTGDAVLTEVSRRLSAITGGSDMYAARLGGDEFNVVVTGDCSDEACERIATLLLEEIGRPYDIGDRRHVLGTSIGIARHPQDGDTVEQLMRVADVAMYEAKRAGRNTYRFYDAEMDARLRERATIEADLRVAVRNHDIEAWFQPITCLDKGAVLGFEALARWNHPTRGMIPPETFIAIAEEAGLIEEITTQILQQSCRAARDWPDHVSVSVNMSPVMLRDSWVIAKTFGIIQQERLRPDRLVIEITESAVIDDLDFAREAVNAFREAGIRVALDDFGCGYSSLSTLRQLAFDHLKLDSSFVKTLGTGDSLKITTAVAGLARAMGMTATAEGVEDAETGELLRTLGFDCGQGYLYGRPTPREEADAIAHHGIVARMKVA
jgi:diguanylate cyclase (GGDEF)-like protein